MALHWLFPTPGLQVDLALDSATAAAMQEQLKQLDAQMYQHPAFTIATTSLGICWAMSAWIIFIARMRFSG